MSVQFGGERNPSAAPLASALLHRFFLAILPLASSPLGSSREAASADILARSMCIARARAPRMCNSVFDTRADVQNSTFRSIPRCRCVAIVSAMSLMRSSGSRRGWCAAVLPKSAAGHLQSPLAGGERADRPVRGTASRLLSNPSGPTPPRDPEAGRGSPLRVTFLRARGLQENAHAN